MKDSFKQIIRLIAAITLLPYLASAALTIELVDPDEFTDFTVSGMSTEKTQAVWESETERYIDNGLPPNIPDEATVELRVLDIDMAGDIQSWRNRNNSDIRYVESIYPPRIDIEYIVKDSDGKVVAEGEKKLRDLSFLMTQSSRIRTYNSFHYEIALLDDWLRRESRSWFPKE